LVLGFAEGLASSTRQRRRLRRRRSRHARPLGLGLGLGHARTAGGGDFFVVWVCGRTSLVAGDLLRAFEGLDPRRFGSCSRGSLVAGTEPRRNLGFCRHRSDVASVAFMSCRRSKRQKLFPVRSFRSIIYSTFSVLGQRPNPNRPLLPRETEETCLCVMPPWRCLGNPAEADQPVVIN
jgi:hypothetical protein